MLIFFALVIVGITNCHYRYIKRTQWSNSGCYGSVYSVMIKKVETCVKSGSDSSNIIKYYSVTDSYTMKYHSDDHCDAGGGTTQTWTPGYCGGSYEYEGVDDIELELDPLNQMGQGYFKYPNCTGFYYLFVMDVPGGQNCSDYVTLSCNYHSQTGGALMNACSDYEFDPIPEDEESSSDDMSDYGSYSDSYSISSSSISTSCSFALSIVVIIASFSILF